MMDTFISFVGFCFSFIPTSVRIGLPLVFCVGTVLFLSFMGFKKGLKWSIRLLFFEYLFLLISLTVLFRELPRSRNCNLVPFRIVRAIMEGDDVFITQAIMNVSAFIPLGFLLGCAFGRIKWWKVLLIGGGLSMIIEILQYVLQRGFAEFDDVFHNVVGCMIGYGVYSLVNLVTKKRSVC